MQAIVASPAWRVTVCVASGPSVTPDQFALIERARSRGLCRVLVVNDNYRWLPNADALYGGDFKWWRHHIDKIDACGFRGERWTAHEKAAQLFGLNHIRCRGLPGLSRDPTLIHGGLNSGYQAIGWSRHRGARLIPLVGYDMQHTGGKAHHFGDHPKELGQAADPRVWVPKFTALADDLKAEGIDVVNCSRQTALTQFRRADLATLLDVEEQLEALVS